ncbi:MAG: hypothetical protein LBW77_02310 [Verrucomicrobiota bacterium]|jgi:hypothetical protein|nr:hypothetical protein [Verrucomicrobiota bacterium]
MKKFQVAAILLCASLGVRAEVDQTQPLITGDNDWSSGISQSFTAGTSGCLIAIRLAALRHNGERDLTVEIRRVDANDIPTGPVLAIGTLSGSAFEADKMRWYTIPLLVPYFQTQGEKLSFTIQFGSPGTPYGYFELAQSTGNPYSGGLLYMSYYEYGTGHSYDTIDLAFQTIVEGPDEPPPVLSNPRLSIHMMPNRSIELTLTGTHPLFSYGVQYCRDLAGNKCGTYWTGKGRAGPIFVDIPYPWWRDEPRMFFAVQEEYAP